MSEELDSRLSNTTSCKRRIFRMPWIDVLEIVIAFVLGVLCYALLSSPESREENSEDTLYEERMARLLAEEQVKRLQLKLNQLEQEELHRLQMQRKQLEMKQQEVQNVSQKGESRQARVDPTVVGSPTGDYMPDSGFSDGAEIPVVTGAPAPGSDRESATWKAKWSHLASSYKRLTAQYNQLRANYSELQQHVSECQGTGLTAAMFYEVLYSNVREERNRLEQKIRDGISTSFIGEVRQQQEELENREKWLRRMARHSGINPTN